MKKLMVWMVALLVMALATPAMAAPVAAFPVAPVVTHCDMRINGGAPVRVVPTAGECVIDVGGVPVGQSTVTATALQIDPIWGQGAAPPTPFGFERPALAPPAASGGALKP